MGAPVSMHQSLALCHCSLWFVGSTGLRRIWTHILLTAENRKTYITVCFLSLFLDQIMKKKKQATHSKLVDILSIVKEQSVKGVLPNNKQW